MMPFQRAVILKAERLRARFLLSQDGAGHAPLARVDPQRRVPILM
jgi:hypothetical protein